MQVYLSLLICIIGLIVFGLTTGDSKEMGRIMFFSGLFVFLLKTADPVLHLLK